MPASHSIVWTSLLAATLVAATGCQKNDKSGKVEASASKPSPTLDDAADAPKPSNIDVVEVVKTVEVRPPLEPQKTEALINEGRAVTAAIGAAITDIDAGNQADAKTELAKAVEGLDELKADRPNVDIAVELWRKDKELDIMETEAAVDTIPLLATVTKIDVPAYNAQELQARHELRKGQAPGSVSKAEKAADLEIIDSSLVYEGVDLPIATTQIHVLAAQQLLDDGKPMEAKDVLQRALGSLEVIEVVMEAPAYQARQLVWDAESAFARGDMNEAQRLLGEAADVLTPLTQTDADPEAKKMATMLLEEMAPMRKVLTSGDTEQLDAFHRIQRDAMSLARRTTMRAAMQSRRDMERLALADALMWLEKAETGGLFEAEAKPGSSGDLLLAEGMLAKAKEQATPSAKPKLDDLHARIQHVIEINKATPRDVDMIKSELRGITFDLRMLMLDLGLAPLATGKPASQG